MRRVFIQDCFCKKQEFFCMHVTMDPTQAKNSVWCTWHRSASLVSLDILLYAALFGRLYLFSSENGHNYYLECLLINRSFSIAKSWLKSWIKTVDLYWGISRGKKILWSKGSVLYHKTSCDLSLYLDKILLFISSYKKKYLCIDSRLYFLEGVKESDFLLYSGMRSSWRSKS